MLLPLGKVCPLGLRLVGAEEEAVTTNVSGMKNVMHPPVQSCVKSTWDDPGAAFEGTAKEAVKPPPLSTRTEVRLCVPQVAWT